MNPAALSFSRLFTSAAICLCLEYRYSLGSPLLQTSGESSCLVKKQATMMLGLVNKQSQNAYELIKVLEWLNVKWWYDIANSTVYATLRTLDSKGFIVGISERNGNIPYGTVYFPFEGKSRNTKKYIAGIENWILYREDISIPFSHIVIVERMADPAKTELAGTNKLLEMLQRN